MRDWLTFGLSTAAGFALGLATCIGYLKFWHVNDDPYGAEGVLLLLGVFSSTALGMLVGMAAVTVKRLQRNRQP